jgi:hypothetical protein
MRSEIVLPVGVLHAAVSAQLLWHSWTQQETVQHICYARLRTGSAYGIHIAHSPVVISFSNICHGCMHACRCYWQPCTAVATSPTPPPHPPASTPSKVVLPAPEGPMMASMRPGSACPLTSFSSCLPSACCRCAEHLPGSSPASR